MPLASSVPTTITPEAAQRIAELGIQEAVAQMLEHARQTIPDLLRLEVVQEGPYDSHYEPYLTIYAYRDLALLEQGFKVEWDFGSWKVRTFPPEVCEHIALQLNFEATDAR